MRWIRWSYVLPRLLAVVVAALAIELGAGVMVRQALITIGQRVVGARVDVAQSRTSLLRSKVVLQGLQVASRKRPMSNLVEADRLELDFETDALLRRKAIASHGVLRGLRFDTPRQSSGALAEVGPDEERASFDWSTSEVVASAQRWFDDFARTFQPDVAQELESVRLAEELAQRWPEKYSELETRAKALKTQAKELEASLKQAQSNPLRHVDVLERLPREIKALDKSLADLVAEVEALPDAVEADRRAILAARGRDEQLIRDKLYVDEINSAALTAYFVHEQLKEPLANLVCWVRWSRELTTNALTEPEPERHRGQDILFAGARQLPDLLVRSLEFAGSARLGGRPVELAGTLTNFTTQPDVHGEPMGLELSTTGSLPLRLAGTFDRTGEVPHDELVIECRDLLLPHLTLGTSDVLAISLAPSRGALHAQIALDGEEIAANVQLVQESVQLTPIVRPELAEWQLDAVLSRALDQLNTLDTTVSISGTLDAPRCDLQSNVGPVVGEALGGVLTAAVAAKSQQLLGQSERYVDEQLAKVDRLVEERTAALLQEIRVPSERLEQLAGSLTTGRGLSFEELGRRLPAGSLFR